MSNTAESVYNFSAKDIRGNDVSLEKYKGKVLVIVNTASQCGYTPQYKGLEALYQKFHADGLEILGFPCNQFGNQEPGNSEEIATFCERNFGVTFPLFEKIDVNGDSEHPLFAFLKNKLPGILGTTAIKWNFTKFTVDKNGNPIKRYGSQDTPESLEGEIANLLK